MKHLRILLLAISGLLLAEEHGRGEPPTSKPRGGHSWVEAMRQVHGRFKGERGTLACFGDSITVSLAFWAPLAGQPGDLPPAMTRDHALVKGYLKPACWAQWRGPGFGNKGSMTIRWAHQNVDAWLAKLNPEVAVVLFGTNDLTEVPLQEFRDKTRQVVDRCLRNGTMVLLTTLPPRSGRLEQSRQFAEVVRHIARQKQVPLIDYAAEVLQRRPDDWDGSLPQFKAAPGDEYQVPTLIARDGVHPSNPRAYPGYSETALRHNGYALRNYLTLRAYAEVIREVLRPTGVPEGKGRAPAGRPR